jgi:hypothetical protein
VWSQPLSDGLNLEFVTKFFNHQDTKGTKEDQLRILFENQRFFLVILVPLVVQMVFAFGF